MLGRNGGFTSCCHAPLRFADVINVAVSCHRRRCCFPSLLSNAWNVAEQFRHYQFDTLRRAKHSSAMVLYHLHRPESRSLNPFCSRCRRPVRYVRYHCGVCNYDL